MDIAIGDRVSLNEFFIIEARGEEFICQFAAEGDAVYLGIPIYCAAFGIGFSEMTYVMPGGSVDSGHPDFLKFLRVERAAGVEKSIFKVFNPVDEVYLRLDENFKNNGKYYLDYTKKSKTVQKIAQIKTEQQRQAEIDAWAATEVNSGVVTGIVIRIYLKEYTRNEFNVPEFTDVIYCDNINEAMHYYSSDREQIFVVIHDEGGDIEYSVPANLINLL